jgi:histone-lysine N-methyltransferase SETMAR
MLSQALITSFGWEQMNQPPPKSPDLAPSDFHLFLHLKKFLAGQRFNNDKDVKRAVQKWLSSQAVTFYDEGI